MECFKKRRLPWKSCLDAAVEHVAPPMCPQQPGQLQGREGQHAGQTHVRMGPQSANSPRSDFRLKYRFIKKNIERVSRVSIRQNVPPEILCRPPFVVLAADTPGLSSLGAFLSGQSQPTTEENWIIIAKTRLPGKQKKIVPCRLSVKFPSHSRKKRGVFLPQTFALILKLLLLIRNNYHSCVPPGVQSAGKGYVVIQCG